MTWNPSTRVVLEVRLAVQRAADADVQRPLHVDQAFFAGPAERRAVGVRRAEVGVPGVEVRVEVQHGDRAVIARQRPQDRQRDGVVAADGQHCGTVAAKVGDRRVDRGDRLVDVERVDRDVTAVGDLLIGERFHLQRRVVRPQQLRRGAYVTGAESGTGAVGHPTVERDSDDADVGGRRPGRCGAAGRTSTARCSADTGWRQQARRGRWVRT